MRSIRLLAAVTGTLVLGSACGGDGGTGPNTPPVAAFTAPACTTGVACTFTDASTDDNAVSTWTWDFGDGTAAITTQNTTHIFAAAGTYSVALTVTDAAALTSTKTNPVVVTDPAPVGPTANFTTSCNGAVCTFTSTSTDDGTIASYLWNFGEPSSGVNNTATTASAPHSYTVATANTAFTVSLTVTDNDGNPATKTQVITLSPPAGLQCNGADCTLDLTSKSTVTITVVSSDCQFVGNAFAITSPIQEQVFSDGCSVTAGTVFQLNGGAAFNAATQLAAQFTQGSGTPSAPPKGPPATRVTGVFPQWTIELDDGGDPTGAGEPDFNDIVLRVDATVVP